MQDLTKWRTVQDTKQFFIDKLKKLQRYDVGTYCDRNWSDEYALGNWIKSADIDNLIKELESQ